MLPFVFDGPDALLRLPVGVVAGFVATLGMDVVMRFLPEGDTPPRVAAGVLTETHPDESPRRLAAFAHYFAGAATGALYAYLTLVSEVLLGGPSAPSTTSAAVFLYAGMVGFFVLMPLPLSSLEEGRARRVSVNWAVCALVYVSVVVPSSLILFAAASSF